MHMHKDHRCWWSKLGWILVLIGALNWGLIGVGYFFMGNWNLVHLAFSWATWIEAIVYILVGVGAILTIIGCRCANCKEGCDTCRVGKAPVSDAPMQGM